MTALWKIKHYFSFCFFYKNPTNNFQLVLLKNSINHQNLMDSFLYFLKGYLLYCMFYWSWCHCFHLELLSTVFWSGNWFHPREEIKNRSIHTLALLLFMANIEYKLSTDSILEPGELYLSQRNICQVKDTHFIYDLTSQMFVIELY